MKTKQNFLSLFLVALLIGFASCSKEGPAGATGPEGAQGPAGPQGVTGTANVIQITYGSKVHTGAELSYSLTGITQTQLNGSAYFTYVNPGNAFWYSLPGTTAGGSREYRTFVHAQASGTPSLLINRVAGTGSETFTSTRVIIIPAGVLTNGRNVQGLDMSDYYAVAKYFNLPTE